MKQSYSTGLGDILDQEDRTPLNKVGRLPYVYVFGGIEGLDHPISFSEHLKAVRVYEPNLQNPRL
jgi:hypothetical protein